MLVMAMFMLLLSVIGSLFAPSGITSTLWFVLGEICALYLTWRWINVRSE